MKKKDSPPFHHPPLSISCVCFSIPAPLDFPLSSVRRWCGESWGTRPDQSCPSGSTSLGTSSKGRCSAASSRKKRESSGSAVPAAHLKTPPSTCLHSPSRSAPYCLQHPYDRHSKVWLTNGPVNLPLTHKKHLNPSL